MLKPVKGVFRARLANSFRVRRDAEKRAFVSEALAGVDSSRGPLKRNTDGFTS